MSGLSRKCRPVCVARGARLLLLGQMWIQDTTNGLEAHTSNRLQLPCILLPIAAVHSSIVLPMCISYDNSVRSKGYIALSVRIIDLGRNLLAVSRTMTLSGIACAFEADDALTCCWCGTGSDQSVVLGSDFS